MLRSPSTIPKALFVRGQTPQERNTNASRKMRGASTIHGKLFARGQTPWGRRSEA